MTIVTIPLTNDPNQSFSVTLPKGDSNITLDCILIWNRIAEYWQLTISDPAKGTLVESLPLVQGDDVYANLLYQYQYLGIGALFICPMSSQTTDIPGLNDWGVNAVLNWIDL